MGRNRPPPASSPVLFSLHHGEGWGTVPQLDLSPAHPKGLALLQCTLTTGLQEPETQNHKRERQRQKKTDMQFGALWSITRIKAGRKGSSSEPGTSHSQEAQHDLVWPPCTQPPPPRGPPSLRPPAPQAWLQGCLPRSPELLELQPAPLLVWHLVQVAAEGHLRVEGSCQVSTKANLLTASGVRDSTGAGGFA